MVGFREDPYLATLTNTVVQKLTGNTLSWHANGIAEVCGYGQMNLFIHQRLAGGNRVRPWPQWTQQIKTQAMELGFDLIQITDTRDHPKALSSLNTWLKKDAHASILRRLAGHIAISIERSQLVSQLKSTNRELAEANKTKDEFLETLRDEVDKQTQQLRRSENRNRLLVDLGQVVNSSLQVREVFEHAGVQIHNLLNCDRVSLLLTSYRETSRHDFAMEFSGDSKQ